jgi:uncharacterized protein (DUF4415 family)
LRGSVFAKRVTRLWTASRSRLHPTPTQSCGSGRKTMGLKLITIRVDEDVLEKLRKAYPNMKYNAVIRHILASFAKRLKDESIDETVKEMEL